MNIDPLSENPGHTFQSFNSIENQANLKQNQEEMYKNNEAILQKLIVEKDKEILEMKKLHVDELRAFSSRIEDLELENKSKQLEIE